jgi:hypothetical protein
MFNNEFTDYKRQPIWISPHTIALIQIFRLNEDNIEDLWLMDNRHFMNHIHMDMHKEAADQFLNQFEGTECAAFLIALRKVITERLKKMDAENGKTSWATEN